MHDNFSQKREPRTNAKSPTRRTLVGYLAAAIVGIMLTALIVPNLIEMGIETRRIVLPVFGGLVGAAIYRLVW